jgi:hypothetical protein
MTLTPVDPQNNRIIGTTVYTVKLPASGTLTPAQSAQISVRLSLQPPSFTARLTGSVK